MNSVEGTNLSETWLSAVEFIVANGSRQGELSKEVLNLVSVIRKPVETSDRVDFLFRKHIGERWINKGADCIFPSTSRSRRQIKWSKDYWGRLTEYRRKVNQLDFIVERLKSKPHSKQLSCVTFDPEIDIQPNRPFNPSMPCMIALDVKLRNGKINVFAVFRSHDFGRKAYGNFVGLGKLLNMFSSETDNEMGEVVCYSISAHIRSKEFESISNLMEEHNGSRYSSSRKLKIEKSLMTYNLT